MAYNGVAGDTEGWYSYVGVGQFVLNTDPRWKKKSALYSSKGILGRYRELIAGYVERLTDAKGYNYIDLAARCAQLELDAYLLKRLRGQACEVPRPLLTEYQARSLVDEAKSDDGLSYVDSMWWIYRHLKVSGVTIDDCPDSGTWGYYQMLLSNPDAQAKFYEVVFPKVASKTADVDQMMEDDQRDRFEVLDVLTKEFSDSQVAVS